jgi:hypothetical protein
LGGKAEGLQLRAFLKNEATDLIENKGSALGGVRNEATVGERRKSAGGKHRGIVARHEKVDPVKTSR